MVDSFTVIEPLASCLYLSGPELPPKLSKDSASTRNLEPSNNLILQIILKPRAFYLHIYYRTNKRCSAYPNYGPHRQDAESYYAPATKEYCDPPTIYSASVPGRVCYNKRTSPILLGFNRQAIVRLHELQVQLVSRAALSRNKYVVVETGLKGPIISLKRF